MHRRPLGRGRRLAALAALIIVVGCFLPWWQFGGDAGLPVRSGNAFEGAGILVFFAALAVIALGDAAVRDRPARLDRPGAQLRRDRRGRLDRAGAAGVRPLPGGALGLPTTSPGCGCRRSA
jgi:hypothetical protein